MKSMYDHLASKGRFGDTELVHVNKQEKAVLKRMGGSGAVNPNTGLKEYNPFIIAAAAAAVAKFGVDLYSQYKAGSSREDSAADYRGLAQGTRDMYTSNMGQIRQEANIKFQGLQNQFDKLTKGLGKKATVASDTSAVPTGGFKYSGGTDFAQGMAIEAIGEEQTQAYGDKALGEQAVQVSTAGKELEAFTRMEEDMAGYEAEAESAENDWYFGKNLRKFFGKNKWAKFASPAGGAVFGD